MAEEKKSEDDLNRELIELLNELRVAFLIAGYIYNAVAGIAVSALTIVLYGGLWYALPLIRRARRG